MKTRNETLEFRDEMNNLIASKDNQSKIKPISGMKKKVFDELELIRVKNPEIYPSACVKARKTLKRWIK